MLIAERAGPAANIGSRNKLASQLFKDEPDEVRAEFEAQAIRDHKEAVKKHEDALAGSASQDPEEQQK